MTDLDFWISEADARYTDEVHPFWCLQQGVVFPRLCREARLWWVLKRCFSNARSTELQVWVFLICLSIFCLQPWKSAPSRMAWWGQTSTRQWNQACSTCLTGSVYSTQVRQVTNEIPLLWRVIPSSQAFFPLQVLFLKENTWTSSPWLNTSTTQETEKLATSLQLFTLGFRWGLDFTVYSKMYLCSITSPPVTQACRPTSSSGTGVTCQEMSHQWNNSGCFL